MPAEGGTYLGLPFKNNSEMELGIQRLGTLGWDRQHVEVRRHMNGFQRRATGARRLRVPAVSPSLVERHADVPLTQQISALAGTENTRLHDATPEQLFALLIHKKPASWKIELRV